MSNEKINVNVKIKTSMKAKLMDIAKVMDLTYPDVVKIALSEYIKNIQLVRTFDSLVKFLGDVEVDKYCHHEEYGSKLAFHLSNIREDSYINHLENELTYSEQDTYNLNDLREAIVNYIKSKIEE